MALPSALDIIAQKESGNRNVRNYKYGPGFTASGYFQITNPTWQRWAKAAGIDLSRYPTAESAPYEVQRQAAAHGFRTEGFKPWLATKDLVGLEKNYAETGTTGAAYPQRTDANGIAGGYTPSELPAGGVGSTDAPATSAQARNSKELEQMLLARFPYLRVTSRDRDPAHNAAVGGAKNSQHTHGTAIDIGMSELTPAQREEVARYAQSIGARGFGYYPKSNSMHFDVRQGPAAFWGGNYSKTSLPQTPEWFQNFAKTGGATGAAYPSVAAPNYDTGVSPSELPWGGGYTPAPLGLLAPGQAAPPPPPSATASPTAAQPRVEPNSDFARMLSDPARYGYDPAVAAQLRAFITPGGNVGNISSPAVGVSNGAPVHPPAAATNAPPGLVTQPPPSSVTRREPTPEEREATRKYLEPLGPGPLGIWNPEKIWWQNPATAPAPKPFDWDEMIKSIPPDAMMQAQAQAPAPGLLSPGDGAPPPAPGQQGQAVNLIAETRRRMPPSLFEGGWA